METILNKLKLNKIFAILMAMLFAFSFSLTGIHAIEQNDTVTVKVNVGDGDQVDIYKLINVNYDFTNDQPNDPMYSWDSNVATWLKTQTDKGYDKYVAQDGSVTDSFTENTNDPEAYRTFLQDLAANLENGTISGLQPTTGATQQLGMGEYLIMGTSTNSGRVYLPTLIAVVPTYDEQSKSWQLEVRANVGVLKPGEDGSYIVNLKGSTLTFDKYIDATGDALVDMKTVGVGDTVDYVLKATVPTYPANAINKTFVIEDTAGKGLTLPSADQVKVYSDQLFKNELTTGVTKNVTDQTVKVDFDYDELVKQTVSVVYITYTATVNEQAPSDDTALKNIATLTYALDPYKVDANGTMTDNEIVYTYAIDVTKLGEDLSTPLSGAQFTLKEGKDLLSFVKNQDGSYTLASKSTTNAVTTLEVNAKGKLVLYGLDTGTYTLTETKAATGMVLPSNPVTTVTLADAEPDGQLDGKYTKVESTIVPTTDQHKPTISGNTLKFKIVNSKDPDFELPNTGGMGTLMFTVGGILLMAGAVVYLVATRKKA